MKMNIKQKNMLMHSRLWRVIMTAVFLSTLYQGNLSSAAASDKQFLSDGQFVYGPNVGDFNLENYLMHNAPHLMKYADDLYGRSEYFSINPKVYLTLLELHSQLISNPNSNATEDPFSLSNGGFISQIDYVSNKMVEAYYLHLYSYSALPVLQRNLEPFTTPEGITINVDSGLNAGTYAVVAGLAAINEQNISLILDNSNMGGFYQTYISLFENDDPLDESNQIFIPGEVGALAAPDYVLQLPYLRGLSWRFGGVHNNSGGTTFTDASSLDFYPWPVSWGVDTSNMWVVAAASGIPTRVSACGFKILHSDGWETTYYHLENTQFITGSINQNDKIGVIANTLAEATCTGGAASGPHVHFSLKRNGAYVAINGTPLSGWYVHSGRYSYDVDPNYMWVEKAGVKKFPYSDTLLSEAPLPPPTVVSITRLNPDPNGNTNVDFTVTFSHAVTGVDVTDFSLLTSGVSGEAVSGISGTGSTYTVSVYTGSGSGTIRLDLVDNDTIKDISNNSLGGAGIGNGSFTSGETYTITKTWIFGDVTNTHWAHSFIERLYNSGITSGCSAAPLLYCPDTAVTRAQMAVFLLKGIHGAGYAPPDVGAGTGFNDVPAEYWAAAWIKQLASEGITSGCDGNSNYCPDAAVSRAQMAVFLLKAKHGSIYTPPLAVGLFTDAPAGYWARNWIEQLAVEAITSGCGGGNYCPDNPVTRDQMAVFLVRTFNLP